jgi:hypothetical protein
MVLGVGPVGPKDPGLVSAIFGLSDGTGPLACPSRATTSNRARGRGAGVEPGLEHHGGRFLVHGTFAFLAATAGLGQPPFGTDRCEPLVEGLDSDSSRLEEAREMAGLLARGPRRGSACTVQAEGKPHDHVLPSGFDDLIDQPGAIGCGVTAAQDRATGRRQDSRTVGDGNSYSPRAKVDTYHPHRFSR